MHKNKYYYSLYRVRVHLYITLTSVNSYFIHTYKEYEEDYILVIIYNYMAIIPVCCTS